MTIRKFKELYEVKLVKLQALENNVIGVSVLVTDKRTGDWDYYSWDPSCFGAEPYNSALDDDGYETIDMLVMQFIEQEIWMKLPVDLASPKEMKMLKEEKVFS